MNSSRKDGSKILGVMPKAEAERLLLAWANLPDVPTLRDAREIADPGGYRRLIERHPEVFGHMASEQERAASAVSERSITIDKLRIWRDRLRLAWTAQDRRSREWHIFTLRFEYAREAALRNLPKQSSPEFDQKLKSMLWDPPPITPLEAALFYFSAAIGDRARKCQATDCPAPFFVALKRWQKFCSPECALPAQREAKRKWWKDNRGGL
jgi:hypothetical protein